LIPPACTLTLKHGRLQRTTLKPQVGVRTVVDVLFNSVADDSGHRAAAVVFSGADTDGAAGFKRIQQRGGFALVQDPTESSHTEMPRAAIATGCAAAVLPVVEMPAQILNHFGRPQTFLTMPVGFAEALLRTKTTPEEDVFIEKVLVCVRE